ncbi:WD40 repeat domain-containing protein, partial [Thermodesulfovibrio sp.]|uniref:WD40 repeat domain-containing protein n=1 Tax=Thermodesulfovibrio sp. TaxID=2067987 RepID=UPI003C7B6640
ETGMHTATIWCIAIDEEERFLVTGSYDKTIRVWELRTGRLIKTIRPPVGDGDEGKIYAVAISPDGKEIVASGWTGYEWDNEYSIYIFDRETGRLIKRIKGLPNGIGHLTYSKDGRLLVATLGLNNGIRVYDTKGYIEVFRDTEYGDSSYGADFDRSGRLVTTSDDGYIRLYDKEFKLIKKKKAPGGKEPYHLSFSPDGTEIVVGYLDSKNVDILSGKDLSHLYSLNTEGVENGNLASVTWLKDGRFVYAGGMWQKLIDNEWKVTIRRWEVKNGSSYIDIPVADNTIMHILPLNNGGAVFGTYEPSFGIIDPAGRLALSIKGNIADLRGMDDKFLISYDGSIIQFGYEQFGKSPTVFDIREKSLISGEKISYQRLNPPITESRIINVTEWKYSFTPKLNGKPIELERYERSRSLAISPDERGFLLGTEWYLRYFDKDGKLLWSVPSPSVTWGVNISGDGKVGVAAYGDGTIRWYRMRDGKELLAFFPHKDRKRWVLWTPKGYYDASAGGEDLIGWHINNGKDSSADFFPAGRFRERFFRPDIIAKVLETLDEEKAIALANEEAGKKTVETKIKDILPPVVTILSPQDGSSVSVREVTLRFSIRNPSG